jgi:hypothetical protein
MKDRRGEDYKNLEDNEALTRIANKVNFDRGRIKERRKMGNPIKETWLFVDENKELNKLGEALISAFVATHESKIENPSFSDVFDLFWKSSQKNLPKLTKRVGMEKAINPKTGKLSVLVKGTGEEVPCDRDDWKKKSQSFLKSFLQKGAKRKGEGLSDRVVMLTKGGMDSSREKQAKKSEEVLSKIGGFSGKPIQKKGGDSVEEAYRELLGEPRQTKLI